MNTLGIVQIIGISVLLAIVLLGLQFVFVRLSAFLEAKMQKASWVKLIEQLRVVSTAGMLRIMKWVVRSLRIVLSLVALYIYISVVLSLLPWTESLANPFANHFIQVATNIWEAIVDYAPSLVRIAVTIFYAWITLKVLYVVFFALQEQYITLPGFYAQWAEPTYKILRFLVFVLALVMIVPSLPGAGSSAFQGVSLVVGAMVTLGSTTAMSNITSGVVLIYTRSFTIGDFIQIDDVVGEVIERDLLTTRLRTSKNEYINFPNSIVMNSRITNITTSAESTGIIAHASVGLGYDTDWKKVHELLMRAAQMTEHTKTQPLPFILHKGLNDYSVAYELNVYVHHPKHLQKVRSELQRNILDIFAQEDIAILSPAHIELHQEGEVCNGQVS